MALGRVLSNYPKAALCVRKWNLNKRVTTRPSSKYVRRDVTLEGASCNTDLFLILLNLSGWNLMKSILFCSFDTSDISL